MGDLETECVFHFAVEEKLLEVIFDEVDGIGFVEAAEGVVGVGDLGVEGFDRVGEDFHLEVGLMCGMRLASDWTRSLKS